VIERERIEQQQMYEEYIRDMQGSPFFGTNAPDGDENAIGEIKGAVVRRERRA
jgi:hypothetical protein